MQSKTKLLDEPKSSGGYEVRQVIRFVLFVRRTNTQLAPAAVEALNEIIDLFPPPAITSFAGGTGDWFDYDAAGLKKQVAKRLIGKDKAINGAANLSGVQANVPDFAADYAGYAIDLETHKNRAAYLVLTVGASIIDADIRSAALELFRRLAGSLGCSAGYVDVALQGKKPRLQALARRFRGVDIASISAIAADLADNMPGVHWINFMGSPLVKKLGGRAKIEAALSENARVDMLEGGGLVVSLGSEPQLGDVNQRVNLTDWESLAKLAHENSALHIPKKVNYFDPEDGLSSMEAQERWHLRFVEA